MKHPKDRGERRAVRDYSISYRKRIAIRRWKDIVFLGLPPQEHDSHWHWERWNRYQEWITLSEDDKKVKEVEARIDGIEFEIPTWDEPKEWGRYSNEDPSFNCRCNCCRHKNNYSYNTYGRKRRRLLKSAGLAQLEECIAHNDEVSGSNPLSGTTRLKVRKY